MPVLRRDGEQGLILFGGDFSLFRELVADRAEEFSVVIGAPPDFFGRVEGDLLEHVEQAFRLFRRRRIEVARLFEPGREFRVELGHHIGPGDFALFDFVEFLLHLRGEPDVEQLRQSSHQKVVDPETEFGRNQLALFPVDVGAVLDGPQDRRIGRGAADAVLFQLLDERRFAVARRRLGELLLRFEILDGQRVAVLEAAEHLGLMAFALALLFLFVDLAETGEDRDRRGGAEGVGVRIGAAQHHVHRGQVLDRRSHLAGNKTPPDRRVEPELRGVEELRHQFRRATHVGRTDRFVRFLRRGFVLVKVRLGRKVRLSVGLADEGERRILRLAGDGHRVGTHVGDETDRAAFADVHAFIELLRIAHGVGRAVAEHGVRHLLEGAGGEGRRRVAFAFGGGHAADFGRRAAADRLHQLLGFDAGTDFEILAVDLEQPGGEFASVFRAEHQGEDPVLFGLECGDRAFAFDHQPQRDRLDAPGAGALFDFRPQQRTHLVADDAVEHPARLLGVDQIDVDLSLFAHRLFDGAPGDLVERHPVERRLGAFLEHFGKVPGDRLSFAVRVGCEIDLVRLLGGGAEFLDHRLAARGIDVLRRETVRDVHAEFAFRQVADMAHRGDDGIIVPEHLADGTGFGWRFDDQKFRHINNKLLSGNHSI